MKPEPQDMPGYSWVMSRIHSGERVSVYTNGTSLYHGGQRFPQASCTLVGTYWKHPRARPKFDLMRFIEDVEATVEHLREQSLTLRMEVG